MSFMHHVDSTIAVGVKIDDIALLRNVRDTAYPSPLEAALIAEYAGADCITCHLREDRRHIRNSDVLALASNLSARINLEIAPRREMFDFACRVRPSDVCLVPERHAELTDAGGLDVVHGHRELAFGIKQLRAAGIRVSLLVDADKEQIAAACGVGAAAIELHTGPYAEAQGPARETELCCLQQGVAWAMDNSLQVYAGHGLHYTNVQAVAMIADIAGINIGHAIVSHALFYGWENAVREMKAVIISARLATARPGTR